MRPKNLDGRSHRDTFFADDGQLYIIFDPVGPKGVKLSKDKMEELFADVSQWLLTHMLMVIGGKTEVLLIHSKCTHFYCRSLAMN